jgi:5'(3')-deoxyribonucleotidase|tara:strand:- start:256 stop:774 length:519 start_codon:yes stop_codon:yes gene_type:complete
MKQLKTMMKVEGVDGLPDIYCDLDQVLVNLMKGADEVVGGSFVTHDKDERWKMINQTKDFWANLEWMPGSRKLYQFIKKYDPYVLSAYSARDPNSQVGKKKWLKKNTEFKKSRINLVKREQKQKYAITDGKPNVLIDDYIKNINEWESKGGIGIHHTNVSKTISELKRVGFK